MPSKNYPPGLAQSMLNSKAQYTNLGTSGLRVSIPILGCATFGDPTTMNWALGEEDALPLLKAAYDRGINTWDTANAYSNGESEILIGKTMKKYEIPREKIVILTKIGRYVGEERELRDVMFPEEMRGSKDYMNQGGLSRTAILTAIQHSLLRLQTTYIDVLQIHTSDPYTPIKETMQTLNDLVRKGKVRYIGASNLFAWQFSEMQFCAERNGWSGFISYQGQWSLLYREEEREMRAFLEGKGVGILGYSPLSRGLLSRPYDSHPSTLRSSGTIGSSPPSPNDLKIITHVQEIAAKKGWTMSQVALVWLLGNRGFTSPICGISSIERMEEILEVRGWVLSEEERQVLERDYVVRRVENIV